MSTTKWLISAIFGAILGFAAGASLGLYEHKQNPPVFDDADVELHCETYGTDPDPKSNPTGKVTLFCEFEKKGVL